MSQNLQVVATWIFGIAILHTFMASTLSRAAHRFEADTVSHKVLHLLGEVEIIFGFWAFIFVGVVAFFEGPLNAIAYVESLDFTEPAFVFVIMAVSATRSIRALAIDGIRWLARVLDRALPKVDETQCFYAVTLSLGALLGSFITEPAAMTVLALILRDRFFVRTRSERFKYKTLAALFVNISIGGVLTHFAAPPVVMVARPWGWGTPYLFTHFGWKAMIAVFVIAILTTWLLRSELAEIDRAPKSHPTMGRPPIWITLTHLTFLALVILTAHHMVVFIGLFLLFMGIMQVTEPHQDRLQIRESLLVAFFLMGLVMLGRPQEWWLTPLLQGMSEPTLFTGALLLTGITDNAALTYLGAQVAGLTEGMKYALLAGAVTGGGLTVIANAPNPVGYGILKDTFENNSVNPVRLLVAAAIPTIIAAVCMWFF